MDKPEIGQAWWLYEMRTSKMLGMVPSYILEITPYPHAAHVNLLSCLNLESGKLFVCTDTRWYDGVLVKLVGGRIV